MRFSELSASISLIIKQMVLERAKVIDCFTQQKVCSINVDDLPKKGEFITIVEADDYASYFEVREITETAEGTEVLILPVMKEWALGFHRMYGHELHFLFAQSDYYSFQNKGEF